MCVCVCLSVCLCLCLSLSLRVCACVCICLSLSLFLFLFVCVCVCVCVTTSARQCGRDRAESFVGKTICPGLKALVGVTINKCRTQLELGLGLRDNTCCTQYFSYLRTNTSHNWSHICLEILHHHTIPYRTIPYLHAPTLNARPRYCPLIHSFIHGPLRRSGRTRSFLNPAVRKN